MTISNEVLQSFCDRPHHEEERPLAKPWRFANRLWACDGRCLLAIRDNNRSLVVAKKPGISNARDLLVPIGGELKSLPGPELETEECGWCFGHGRIQVLCLNCEGEGEHYCDKCEEKHPCGKCHGDGMVNGPQRCPLCQGKKVSPVDQRIEGVKFRGWHLQRIRLLGDVRYWLVDPDRMRFSGDGFEGLLMSLKDDSDGTTT